jgi:ribosomal protein L20A (L18A)
MPTFKGKWVARVEQEFEVEAEDEAEAIDMVHDEMSPHRVVELLDMDVVEIEEVTKSWEEVADEQAAQDENFG